MNDYLPTEFNLGQNYPNPFREKTTIKYCIAYKTRVVLTIYNSEGEVIEKLIDEEKKPGTYEVIFESAVHSGQLAIRDYFYRLQAGDYTNEKRMQVNK
jgi:hypothetical protein